MRFALVAGQPTAAAPDSTHAPNLDLNFGKDSAVRAAVEQAKAIYTLYNAADQLTRGEPWDYNRLPEVSQGRIIEWMRTHCGSAHVS